MMEGKPRPIRQRLAGEIVDSKVKDRLSDDQRELFDRSVGFVDTMQQNQAALLEAHISVQALAARNAAATINNMFGPNFREFQPRAKFGRGYKANVVELTRPLEDLATTLDLLSRQMVVKPEQGPSKVEVLNPAELIAAYNELIEKLPEILTARLDMFTNRIDALLNQLYVFWEKAYPLINSQR